MAPPKLEDLRVFRAMLEQSSHVHKSGSRAESELKAPAIFIKDCAPFLCTCGDICAILRKNAIDLFFFHHGLGETFPV